MVLIVEFLKWLFGFGHLWVSGHNCWSAGFGLWPALIWNWPERLWITFSCFVAYLKNKNCMGCKPIKTQLTQILFCSRANFRTLQGHVSAQNTSALSYNYNEKLVRHKLWAMFCSVIYCVKCLLRTRPIKHVAVCILIIIYL